MAITDNELREIFASAPVSKEMFEVITISASWFTQDYHLQNTFTDDIDILDAQGATITALYAPMSMGLASSNADMNHERTINIQQVNDIIAAEITNRDPTSEELPKLKSQAYTTTRDGVVSIAAGEQAITTDIIKTTRDSIGTNITSSVKPVNAQATGEVITTTRFEMLKGFL